MIIQERADIRLVIAEYDQDYVDYIQHGVTKKGADASLLMMQEYGPWDTGKPRDMAELGPVLLALTMAGGKLD